MIAGCIGMDRVLRHLGGGIVPALDGAVAQRYGRMGQGQVRVYPPSRRRGQQLSGLFF
jgi:hypothetical protein